MRKKLLRLLRYIPVVMLLAASGASAQTTGILIGVVTDASTGKPVAGALVIATSPSLQGEQTAVTDDTGSYRIAVLPPGAYKLAVQLEGYKPAERTDIVVRLDKTLRANLSIIPEAVQMEEQVVRTGATPVINVGSAETGSVVTKEFVASVPMGRDFQSTAIVAPSAQVDTYGVSFNGASSPENGYILDGMNVTDPAFGTLGSNILTNFVDEIDVKTGSFMPEFGRSTAGIINVITKSGSNEFHGSIFGNITPGFLSVTGKPVARDAEAVARESTFNHGGFLLDGGAELGGPILKDKLWFYVGAAPVLNRYVDRRFYQTIQEDPNNPGNALRDSNGLAIGREIAGTSKSYNDDNFGYQVTAKLTYLFNENHNLAVSFYRAPSTRDYLLQPDLGQGTESALLQSYSLNPNDLIGRYSGKFLDKHLVVEAQGGWHHQTTDNNPTTVTVNGVAINQLNTAQTQWRSPHSLTNFVGPLAGCTVSASGFDPCSVVNFLTGGYGYAETIKLDRVNARLAGSYLFSGLGHHNVKVGLDFERNTYNHDKLYSGGAFVREQLPGAAPTFQDFRQYGIAAADGNSADIFTHLGVTSITNSRAFFAQDSWSILDQVTLNAGIRWETQDMYKQGSDITNFNINDNIGPRVQAIWDFTGQGRGKVSASWGRFYEALPLDMGDRSFGGETQVRDLRTACVTPSTNLYSSEALDPRHCDVIQALYPAAGAAGPYAPYATSTTPVAPDLKGQYVDQFGGGVEYEVLPDLSIGFSYEGRRLGRVIEDMSTDDFLHSFIANPGESKPFGVNAAGDAVVPCDAAGVAAGTCAIVDPRGGKSLDPVTGREYTAQEPLPERKYDGFTFLLRKNFSKKWLAQASYTYSSIRGNYPGLFRTENAQLDPNILSEYDLMSLLPNKNGPLPNDRPHQIKLFGAYVWEFGPRMNLTTGGAFRAQSGTPVNILGAHPDYGPGEAFILPRGMAGRTPFNTQVDVLAGLDYALAAPYRLRFTLDVFNLFNSQTILNVDQNYTFDSVQPIVGATCSSKNAASSNSPIAAAQADCPDLKYLKTIDGRPVTVNRNFGRATAAPAPTYGYAPPAYQTPLQVRVGVALSF